MCHHADIQSRVRDSLGRRDVRCVTEPRRAGPIILAVSPQVNRTLRPARHYSDVPPTPPVVKRRIYQLRLAEWELMPAIAWLSHWRWRRRLTRHLGHGGLEIPPDLDGI